MESHYEHTVNRITNDKSKYILAIQDQMRLNYTKHKAKTDLGTIGKAGNTIQYGLIQHSVLCVTDQNVPLGIIDLKLFDYEEFDTTIDHAKRKLNDKASSHWTDALKNMRKRLGDIKKRIITVADRESDFYEFMHPLIQSNEEFVIRAKHDRCIGETYKKNGEKLWDVLNNASIIGDMEVIVQDVSSREIKELHLNLKAIEVILPPPKKFTKEQQKLNNYKSLKINVVTASNADHEWVLFTKLPIDTIEQIKEIVEIYRARWHIEDYHKVLKTGYQVDEIYLHNSRQAIENLLIMASISACRLYWLIYVGRSESAIKADQVFEEFEWKSVYVFFKEEIPKECPALSEVMLKIARLGGYKETNQAGKPGIKTMWTGFQHFTIAAQMYRNMSSNT